MESRQTHLGIPACARSQRGPVVAATMLCALFLGSGAAKADAGYPLWDIMFSGGRGADLLYYDAARSGLWAWLTPQYSTSIPVYWGAPFLPQGNLPTNDFYPGYYYGRTGYGSGDMALMYRDALGNLIVAPVVNSPANQTYLLQSGKSWTGAQYIPRDCSRERPFYIGDFNGDGASDVFCAGLPTYPGTTLKYYVALADPVNQRFKGFTIWNHSLFTQSAANVFVGDFNGDGADDIGYFCDIDGHNVFSVELSNKSNSFNASGTGTWVGDNMFGHYDPRAMFFVGYFNNDSKADLAYFNPDEQAMYVALSTGSSLPYSGQWSAPYMFGSLQQWFLIGDWNGDGLDDLGYYNHNENAFYVEHSDGTKFTGIEQWLPPSRTYNFGVPGDTTLPHYSSQPGRRPQDGRLDSPYPTPSQSGLKLVSAGPTSLQVTWQNQSLIEAYSLVLTYDSNGKFVSNTKVVGQVPVGTSQYATVSGLNPNSTYNLYLVTGSSEGKETWGPPGQFKTSSGSLTTHSLGVAFSEAAIHYGDPCPSQTVALTLWQNSTKLATQPAACTSNITYSDQPGFTFWVYSTTFANLSPGRYQVRQTINGVQDITCEGVTIPTSPNGLVLAANEFIFNHTTCP